MYGFEFIDFGNESRSWLLKPLRKYQFRFRGQRIRMERISMETRPLRTRRRQAREGKTIYETIFGKYTKEQMEPAALANA
jgi:hypothetical protein